MKLFFPNKQKSPISKYFHPILKKKKKKSRIATYNLPNNTPSSLGTIYHHHLLCWTNKKAPPKHNLTASHHRPQRHHRSHYYGNLRPPSPSHRDLQLLANRIPSHPATIHNALRQPKTATAKPLPPRGGVWIVLVIEVGEVDDSCLRGDREGVGVGGRGGEGAKRVIV